jgi:ribose transport system substrate-binding protein
MPKRAHGLRPLSFLVALALVAGLAACGSSDDASDGGGGTASGGKYDITLIPGIRGDRYYVAMQCGAEAEARRLGVNLEMQGGTAFDPSSQTPVVQAVAATKPDGIVVAPVDAKAMFIPLQQASDGGAKVALVDTWLDDRSFAVSSIASDYRSGGVQGAEIVDELTGGRGKVVQIGIKPGLANLDAGHAGFEEGIARYDGIEYLGIEYGNNDQVRVASIVAALLQKEPDLNAIFLPSGADAEGVGAALRRAGKVGEVKVVAYDGYPAQVEQIEKGELQALIVQKPYEMGALGVRQVVNALEGRPVEKEIATDLVVATRDNIDSPEVTRFLYRSC